MNPSSVFATGVKGSTVAVLFGGMALVVMLSLLAPKASEARESSPTVYMRSGSPPRLIVLAHRNRDDHISVEGRGDNFYIRDPAGLRAGRGCELLDEDTVRCSGTGDAISHVYVTTRRGDDNVKLGPGLGRYAVRISLWSGDDRVKGVTGDDTAVQGGRGSDWVRLTQRTSAPQIFRFRFRGRTGADSAEVNQIGTGEGLASASFIGGGGPDRLFGSIGHDLIQGGPGADVLRGRMGGDDISGNAGADFEHGGPGEDNMGQYTTGHPYPSDPGADSYFGGDDGDFLYTGDQRRDRLIDCGPGEDHLPQRDEQDPPALSCEDQTPTPPPP